MWRRLWLFAVHGLDCAIKFISELNSLAPYFAFQLYHQSPVEGNWIHSFDSLMMMTPSSSVVTSYSTTDGKHRQAIPIQTILRSTDRRNSLSLNSYSSVLPNLWFHCPTNNISKSVSCKDRKASQDIACWPLPPKKKEKKRKSERKPGWWNKPQNTVQRTGWLLRDPGGREGVCRRGSERPSWRTPLY